MFTHSYTKYTHTLLLSVAERGRLMLDAGLVTEGLKNVKSYGQRRSLTFYRIETIIHTYTRIKMHT